MNQELNEEILKSAYSKIIELTKLSETDEDNLSEYVSEILFIAQKFIEEFNKIKDDSNKIKELGINKEMVEFIFSTYLSNKDLMKLDDVKEVYGTINSKGSR